MTATMMLRKGIAAMALSVVSLLPACGFGSASVRAADFQPAAPTNQPTRPIETSPSSVPPAEKLPDSASINGTGGSPDPLSAYTFMAAVIDDADRVWTQWMLARGYQEPYVEWVIIRPDESYQAPDACALDQDGVQSATYTSDFPNAFYCDVPNSTGQDKGILVLPLNTFIKMWNGQILGNFSEGAVGDFAAAAVVAHEFGHHIARELESQVNYPYPTDKNKELLADCFSGVWSNTLWQAGGLEDGDADEAMAALRAVGDDGTGPDPHGTPAERELAFRIGIAGYDTDPRGGVPAMCIDKYWAGFPGPR
jgi:predicted metalloprotease